MERVVDGILEEIANNEPKAMAVFKSMAQELLELRKANPPRWRVLPDLYKGHHVYSLCKSDNLSGDRNSGQPPGTGVVLCINGRWIHNGSSVLRKNYKPFTPEGLAAAMGDAEKVMNMPNAVRPPEASPQAAELQELRYYKEEQEADAKERAQELAELRQACAAYQKGLKEECDQYAKLHALVSKQQAEMKEFLSR